jgi:hypothetical protein
MKPESSIPCSEESSTGPYAEPNTLRNILTRNLIKIVCSFLIIKSVSSVLYNEGISMYALKSRAIGIANMELVSNVLENPSLPLSPLLVEIKTVSKR